MMNSEMAKINKESNGTSSSNTENASEKGSEKDSEKVSEKKASAPSPSKSPPADSNPTEKAPSKPPPPPSSPPHPSPPPPPPSPSRSPPPSISTPPPKAQTPPEAPPPDSSPPPSKVSPPRPSQSSPPQSSRPPKPPLSSPPAPSFSPPPPLPEDNSPTPSQSKSPPPSPQAPSLPSPTSKFNPPPPHSHPSPPQSPSISPSSRSKPSPSPPKSNSQSKQPSSNPNPAQYIGFTLAAVLVIAFIAIILLLVLKKKEKRGNVYSLQPPKKSQMKGDVHYYVESPGFGYTSNRNHLVAMQHFRSPSDPTQQQMNTGQIFFSYEQVVEITNEFSSENVIGEGGFGRVYKASMPDGRVGAVKLLKVGSGQGEREFRAEVDIISRVHHRHLVSLIGYCISEQQRVLIYEFVPNGNLDQHLHENEWNVLDWSKRMKIAIGAARGLAYLHEGCNPKIIHRDIKSSNILLDNAYEAQVADFGLARLTDDANTHVSTRVMGTFGYMAPEYATSGKLTDRSDVFSFGVVLLELITGRKPVDATQPVGDESLVEWARPLLLRVMETGDFNELADPRLQRQYVESEMFRMIEAAAACVRHSGPKRPRMVQIARALDSGDQLYDLSNGVKYGQSTVYDSGQYNEDLMRFKRMANGSFDESEFDMYSSEYSTRDMPSGSAWIPQTPRGDSQIKPVQD